MFHVKKTKITFIEIVAEPLEANYEYITLTHIITLSKSCTEILSIFLSLA